MERKFVVRYQGASGGFLVSWLLQLAHDQRKSKSPSHAVDALNRFPLTLKNKPLEWKNHELTPPDIGILCNSFYDLYENHFDGFLLEEDVHELLQRTINKDTKLYSVADFRMRVKYYFCNYVLRRQASNPLWGIAAGSPEEEPWIYDGDNIMDIIKLSDLLFNPNKVLFVNNYKNKLNMFPIESIWEGTWQEHIEKFINRELTAHQIQVCKLLIGRWLYVTPQSIKDEFNI
jgi:hypothetical protein